MGLMSGRHLSITSRLWVSLLDFKKVSDEEKLGVFKTLLKGTIRRVRYIGFCLSS